MTGCVVEDARIDRLEVDVQLAGLVQHPEVLADVIDAGADRLGAGDLQQVRVVVLEHQSAGGRAGDDVDAGREHAQPSYVLDTILARQVSVRVDYGRNAAALLAGDDDLDAIALQYRDHLLAQASLVEIDPAAIKVGDRSAGLPPPLRGRDGVGG